MVSGQMKGGGVRGWGNGLDRQLQTSLLQHPSLGPTVQLVEGTVTHTECVHV